MTATEPATLAVGLLAGCLALVGGYLVGSIPIAARIGRLAGMDAGAGGEGRLGPGTAEVWRTAGPGWGLLALTGEVAQGLLPVAVAGVTWTWWAGWAAAIGAVAGTRRPLLGRLPCGRDPLPLAGASVALSPLAGVVAAVVALVAAGVTHALRGDARFAATVAGFGSFLVLAALDQGDAVRVAAIAVLYVATVVPCPSVRR